MSTVEKEALQTIIAELMAIPADRLTYPNMPVATFATECESLKATYVKDSLHFLKRHIDTAILAEKLDLGVSALREAEMIWSEEVQNSSNAKQTWNELQDEAYELNDEAEASLDFILEENSAARSQLEAILEGTGHSDMILDLGKLARLCDTHREELNKIAFTDEMISRLDELYITLTDVYGEVTSDKGDANEARTLRDRAFVYCKDIEKQIKKAAKLVLRKEPELLKRYRSEYQYKLNMRKKNSEVTL